MDAKKITRNIVIAALGVILGACQLPNVGKTETDLLVLPYIKNSPNECYFLDEFMPVPHNLVTGRTASLNLRYYTYNKATYKEWKEKNQVVLSFYSRDNQCWSLYEEYYVAE